MSVLIKDMKMPKKCNECSMCVYEGQGGYSCRVLHDVRYDYELKPWKRKRKDCPLIEVPDGHGRLIDADALKDSLIVEYPSVTFAINNAPTVIPAEEGET